MYIALTNDNASSNILSQVAIWCIGEFGDLLVANKGNQEPDAITVSENDVIELLEKMIKLAGTQSPITREYILTALMKLTTRFSSSSTQKLRDLITLHKTHMDVELQQRACEYSNLFNWGSIAQKVLERIPIQMESKEISTPKLDNHRTTSASPGQSIIDFGESSPSSNGTSQVKSTQPTNQPPKAFDPYAEIFGDLPVSLGSPMMAPTPLTNAPVDDLMGLLSSPPMLNPTPMVTMTPTPQNTLNPLHDLGLGLSTPAANPVVNTRPPLNGPLPQFTGFSKNGVVGLFDVVKQASHPNITAVTASFVNNTPNTLVNFEFKAAVPKYIKLQVSNPSGNVIDPSGRVTQQLKLLNTNHGEKPLLLKVKIDYMLNGQPYSDIADVSFPEGV